jgi:hypothetical protein
LNLGASSQRRAPLLSSGEAHYRRSPVSIVEQEFGLIDVLLDGNRTDSTGSFGSAERGQHVKIAHPSRPQVLIFLASKLNPYYTPDLKFRTGLLEH